MTVNAPFRFARINRWIHSPAWAPLVSHDVPFADGLSGTATVTVTARTPLLVGGRRRKATNAQAGEVWPLRLPDGRYALPGSTMQGLCRQILEIAAFGRLGGRIDKRRFGIRDLGGSRTAQLHYKDRLTRTVGNTIVPQSKAGWLIRIGAEPHILPCDFARISFDHVADIRAALPPFTAAQRDRLLTSLRNGGNDAAQRARAFLDGRGLDAFEAAFAIAAPADHFHNSIGRRIRERLCTPAAAGGGTPGTLVFTGKVGGPDPMGPRKKKREFVFFGPSRGQLLAARTAGATPPGAAPLPVDQVIWEAFHFMHSGEDGSGRKSPAWEFWEGEYNAGRPVPVFWWEEKGQVATFGMAMGFKAAWPLSTHDLLGHSHPDHLTALRDAAPDLPDLIFGMAAEGAGGRGLKRRAWFGTGICANPNLTLRRTSTGVLAAPKPKYLGLYVRQRPATDNRIPQNGNEPLAGYASFDFAGGNAAAREALKRPELAGVKIWPAVGADFAPGGEITLPPSPRIQGQPANIGEQVKVRLNLLPAGTVFTLPLTFHNLRPAELGALLWALSFGDPRAFGGQGQGARLRHRLGMGKPFNFGEVEISVTDLALDDPPADWADKAATDFVQAFEDHMTAACRAAPGAPAGADWATSPQVLALRKAADPTANGDVLRGGPNRPAYMNVTGTDSYKENADQGYFLGPYVDENRELPKPPPGTAAAPAAGPGGPAPGALPPGASAGLRGAPAASPSAAGRAAAPATAQPPPDLRPQVGARVKVHPRARREIAGREGRILQLPARAGGNFRLVDDEGRVFDAPAGLCTVIAPPGPQP